MVRFGREVQAESSGEEGRPDAACDGASDSSADLSDGEEDGRSDPDVFARSSALFREQRRRKERTLMPDHRLAPNLRRDRREPPSNPSQHLTQHELKRRAIEVPRAHHQPRPCHVDEDADDPDPAVPLRDFGADAGDDGGGGGGKDVGLGDVGRVGDRVLSRDSA